MHQTPTSNTTTKDQLLFSQVIDKFERQKKGLIGTSDNEDLTDQDVVILKGLLNKVDRQERLLKSLMDKLGNLTNEADIYEQKFNLLQDENQDLSDKV